MEIFDVLTWLVFAALLMVAHVGLVRDRGWPAMLFASVTGALVGGALVPLLALPRLAVEGFSFGALISAIIGAELGIVIAIGAMSFDRPALPR